MSALNVQKAPSQDEMDGLMEFARQLAQASGEIIRRYYRSDYTVETKSDDSPVTVADREAEEVMRELIGRKFPDHGVFGEEYGKHLPNAAYQWVLDPIDGTKNFVAGGYLFGTLIALLRDGQPIVGVINQPILGDLLIGNRAGAWLNDRPVHVRVRPRRRCDSAQYAALECGKLSEWCGI